VRFYFHEHAETEFDRIVEYYEDCRRGLGIEFAQEVNAAIARIIQHPLRHGHQCPRILVAAWSIGSPLALYIN